MPDASHFDRLELSRDTARAVAWPGGGGFQPVTVRVNGVELLELVRRVELPFAEAEFDARVRDGDTEAELGPRGDLAGRYLYLPASLTSLPSRNLLGAPYNHGFVLDADDPRRGMSLLLGCTCGIIECWFLLARITVGADRVTWSGFRQFHRDWTFDLGPFVFERRAYEAELAPRSA